MNIIYKFFSKNKNILHLNLKRNETIKFIKISIIVICLLIIPVFEGTEIGRINTNIILTVLVLKSDSSDEPVNNVDNNLIIELKKRKNRIKSSSIF